MTPKIQPRYIGPALVDIAGKRQTVECYKSTCSKCGTPHAFVGWDLGKPASFKCFYCVLTEEYEHARRHPNEWHPDIAEEIAQAEAAERVALRCEQAEAELAKLKAKAKRPETKADPLKRAILETLRRMATAWPAGEVPSSRLWASLVDRGAVVTVRPGLAAETEPHRFYLAKAALIRDGHMTEARGFVRLARSTAAPDLEPSFQD